MFKHETQIRVRYGETDQMGYVYHGNYALYYEVARVEALRELGFSYKKMEEGGTMLPVHELDIKYLKPAYYDDVLRVVVAIKEPPVLRLKFNYEVYNSKNELLNTGNVVLVFIDKATNKPIRCPKPMLDKIIAYL